MGVHRGNLRRLGPKNRPGGLLRAGFIRTYESTIVTVSYETPSCVQLSEEWRQGCSGLRLSGVAHHQMRLVSTAKGKIEQIRCCGFFYAWQEIHVPERVFFAKERETFLYRRSVDPVRSR